MTKKKVTEANEKPKKTKKATKSTTEKPKRTKKVVEKVEEPVVIEQIETVTVDEVKNIEFNDNGETIVQESTDVSFEQKLPEKETDSKRGVLSEVKEEIVNDVQIDEYTDNAKEKVKVESKKDIENKPKRTVWNLFGLLWNGQQMDY